MDAEGVKYIEIKTDNKEDYYRILDELSEINKDVITVSGTSRNPLTLIVEDTREEDVDEVKDTSIDDAEESEDSEE